MSSESDESPAEHDAPTDDGLVVRILGVVLTPFVLLSEGLGKVVMAFFGAAEKLNPMTALRALLKPVEKLAMRLLRQLRNPLARIERVADRVLRSLQRWAAPLTSHVRRLWERVTGALVTFGQSVLRSTESFRSFVSRTFHTIRDVWRQKTAPLRDVTNRLRKRFRRSGATTGDRRESTDRR